MAHKKTPAASKPTASGKKPRKSSSTSSVGRLAEASDPATSADRLVEFASSDRRKTNISRAAMRNPSFPQEVWQEKILEGHPEAWDNPNAALWVFGWIGTDSDFEVDLPSFGAKLAIKYIVRDPRTTLSEEGREILLGVFYSWWRTETKAQQMLYFLSELFDSQGKGRKFHKQAVFASCVCIRSIPGWTDKEKIVIERVESWCQGGKDLRSSAKKLRLDIKKDLLLESKADANKKISAERKALNELLHLVVEMSTADAYTSYVYVTHIFAELEVIPGLNINAMADLIREKIPVPLP